MSARGRLYPNMRKAWPDLDAQYSPSMPKQYGTYQAQRQDGVYIPRHPQVFFKDLDSKYLVHPSLKDASGQPVQVKELTRYQVLAWLWPGNLFIKKGSKMGITTSELLHDFQFCLLPETAGWDVIVGAPTQQLANDHLRTIKLAVDASAKYSKYLIRSAAEAGFKDEQTKTETLFISNPYNPKRNARIMALGNSLATTWSWKNVGRVHLSDTWRLNGEGMSEEAQEEYYTGIFSRLANTGGQVLIESPPDGQVGYTWKLLEQIHRAGPATWQTARTPGAWGLMELTSWDAVDAGLISRAWLLAQKKLIGDLLFSQIYEGAVLSAGNTWYKGDWMHVDEYRLED